MYRVILSLILSFSNFICFAQIDSLQFENLSNIILQMKSEIDSLKIASDSLTNQLYVITEKQDSTEAELFNQISSNKILLNSRIDDATNQINTINSEYQSYFSYTLYSVAFTLLGIIIIIFIYLSHRKKIGYLSANISTINENQKKIIEDTLSLDTKFLEILQLRFEQLNDKRAIESTQQKNEDHSIFLQIANEITRMEKNLYRMDESIKGRKPLLKAIERIKETFGNYGYEIETYIGKPYFDGLNVDADFVSDNELPEGSAIITAATKAQVLFNGKLIQKATIKVSQNI